MVDKKMKPVAVLLPKDSWQKMKEVANDPSLRDPKTIGHVFTKETKGKLRVGKEDFLLAEEDMGRLSRFSHEKSGVPIRGR